MELLLAAGLIAAKLRRAPGLTGTQRANAQRRAQIRRANNAREIPIWLVARKCPISKTGELLHGCRFTRPTGADLCAFKSMGMTDRSQGIPIRHQVCFQIDKARWRLNRDGLLGLNLAPPIAQEWAIHPIGGAGSCFE